VWRKGSCAFCATRSCTFRAKFSSCVRVPSAAWSTSWSHGVRTRRDGAGDAWVTCYVTALARTAPMDPAMNDPLSTGRRAMGAEAGVHGCAQVGTGSQLTSLSTPARSAVGLGREIALPACGFTPRSQRALRPRTLGPPLLPDPQWDARERAGLGALPSSSLRGGGGDPHCNENVSPGQASAPALRESTAPLHRCAGEARASRKPVMPRGEDTSEIARRLRR
jgi:hypothetical protein